MAFVNNGTKALNGSGTLYQLTELNKKKTHKNQQKPTTPNPNPNPKPNKKHQPQLRHQRRRQHQLRTHQNPSTPTPTPACTPTSQGFDDITTLPGAGWVQTNHSTTIGTTGWFQGNSAVFPAQGGAATSYIGANFNNTTSADTISNWLLTPPLTLQNGAVLTFWTRTVDAPAFPDRLQVRMSTNGASSNVGTTATDVGDFTTLLLDINPTYT